MIDDVALLAELLELLILTLITLETMFCVHVCLLYMFDLSVYYLFLQYFDSVGSVF